MDNREKLIKYIENDPEIYKLIQSPKHLNILEILKKDTLNINQILKKTEFKKLSILYNILDTLISKKFIKKIEVDEKELYYLTDLGKDFLDLYKKTKDEFKL